MEFKGTVKNVVVYNHNMSSKEIASLYAKNDKISFVSWFMQLFLKIKTHITNRINRTKTARNSNQ